MARSIAVDVVSRLSQYTIDNYDDVVYDIEQIYLQLQGANNDRINQILENGDVGDIDAENLETELKDVLSIITRLYNLCAAFARHLDESPEQRSAVVKELAKKYKLTTSDRGEYKPSDIYKPTKPVIRPGFDEYGRPLQPSTAVGHGGKNWIAQAIKKPGALTKAAKRHGETPMEYAKDVLAHPAEHTATTKKRATLAKTLVGLHAKGGKRFNPRAFNAAAQFDRDGRTAFGNQSGAYLGESLGQQVAVQNVPIPVEPDGTYVNPTTGYTRPVFPKMPIDKKPSNELRPIKQSAPPMFQDSAKGIFSAPRMTMPPVVPKVPKAFSGNGKPVCHHCHKAVAHRKPCPKA
jgi:hypothetical protein